MKTTHGYYIYPTGKSYWGTGGFMHGVWGVRIREAAHKLRPKLKNRLAKSLSFRK
jgi:hypothetical protein